MYIACEKAAAYRNTMHPDELIITADTIVWLDGVVMGKPHNEDDARQMLWKLSGKTHQVITGVCLTTAGAQRSFSAVTEVTFAELSDEEIDSLIAVSMSDFANPTYTLSETAEGTKLIIVDENSEHDEYAEVFTVYQGYFIGLLLEPAGDVQVSQEELDMAVQFLSDMQFVHTEA